MYGTSQSKITEAFGKQMCLKSFPECPVNRLGCRNKNERPGA